MITKKELSQNSVMTGFNLGQLEKDYLQHLFLIFLSRNSANELVFKGGTALQKCYGLRRFSIDLDFTQITDNELSMVMEKITKNINDFGYPSQLKEIKTLGKTYLLKIQGPLYNNTQISISTLRIEISKREHVIKKPQLKEIKPIYLDLQPYTVMVMDEQEILAEKVRAIMTRNKPRDIFDLHFLISRGVVFEIDLINKKLYYYKESFDKKRFIGKVLEKKGSWENELRNLVSKVPDFDKIAKEIIGSLK